MIYQIKQSELPEKLMDLIAAALRGETVLIEGDDQTVVQLLPIKSPGVRKAGRAKGLIAMSEDFDAPLTDFKDYMP